MMYAGIRRQHSIKPPPHARLTLRCATTPSTPPNTFVAAISDGPACADTLVISLFQPPNHLVLTCLFCSAHRLQHLTCLPDPMIALKIQERIVLCCGFQLLNDSLQSTPSRFNGLFSLLEGSWRFNGLISLSKGSWSWRWHIIKRRLCQQCQGNRLLFCWKLIRTSFDRVKTSTCGPKSFEPPKVYLFYLMLYLLVLPPVYCLLHVVQTSLISSRSSSA